MQNNINIQLAELNIKHLAQFGEEIAIAAKDLLWFKKLFPQVMAFCRKNNSPGKHYIEVELGNTEMRESSEYHEEYMEIINEFNTHNHTHVTDKEFGSLMEYAQKILNDEEPFASKYYERYR